MGIIGKPDSETLTKTPPTSHVRVTSRRDKIGTSLQKEKI